MILTTTNCPATKGVEFHSEYKYKIVSDPPKAPRTYSKIPNKPKTELQPPFQLIVIWDDFLLTSAEKYKNIKINFLNITVNLLS